METVCLRYFNGFGPRQDQTSQYAAVIPLFITATLDERQPVIHSDGTQPRDFVYVENVVEANLLACQAKDGLGATFNIACGPRLTLLELVAELEKVMGKKAVPQFGPPRPNDIQHSQADIQEARERFGYSPEVQFEEGLRRTVAFFGNHKGPETEDLQSTIPGAR